MMIFADLLSRNIPQDNENTVQNFEEKVINCIRDLENIKVTNDYISDNRLKLIASEGRKDTEIDNLRKYIVNGWP